MTQQPVCGRPRSPSTHDRNRSGGSSLAAGHPAKAIPLTSPSVPGDHYSRPTWLLAIAVPAADAHLTAICPTTFTLADARIHTAVHTSFGPCPNRARLAHIGIIQTGRLLFVPGTGTTYLGTRGPTVLLLRPPGRQQVSPVPQGQDEEITFPATRASLQQGSRAPPRRSLSRLAGAKSASRLSRGSHPPRQAAGAPADASSSTTHSPFLRFGKEFGISFSFKCAELGPSGACGLSRKYL